MQALIRGSEDERPRPTGDLWTMLALVNLLALTYPIHLLLRVSNVAENLICVVVGCPFLIALGDAASIVVAEAVALVNAETAREPVR